MQLTLKLTLLPGRNITSSGQGKTCPPFSEHIMAQDIENLWTQAQAFYDAAKRFPEDKAVLISRGNDLGLVYCKALAKHLEQLAA